MAKTKLVALAGVMAALTTVLSLEPFVLPIAIGPFTSKIHFTQLPIFISGVLGGPWAGLLTGAIGGIYMSFSVGIPFIIGGLGLLGFSTGIFAQRIKLRPVISSILAWGVQAPYVFITDYLWFVFSRLMPAAVALPIVGTILLNITLEIVIAAILTELLVPQVQRIAFPLK